MSPVPPPLTAAPLLAAGARPSRASEMRLRRPGAASEAVSGPAAAEGRKPWSSRATIRYGRISGRRLPPGEEGEV